MVKSSKIKEKDAYYLEMLKKDLKCSICLEIFVNPIMDKCGHSFCKKCIYSHLENNELSLCPLSNKKICEEDFIESFVINSLLEKFDFSCELCNKIISRSDKKKIVKHKKICKRVQELKNKTKDELIKKIIDLEENEKLDKEEFEEEKFKIEKFYDDIKTKKIDIKKIREILKIENRKKRIIIDIKYKFFSEEIKDNNFKKYYSGGYLRSIFYDNCYHLFFFELSKENNKLLNFYYIKNRNGIFNLTKKEIEVENLDDLYFVRYNNYHCKIMNRSEKVFHFTYGSHFLEKF